MIILKKRYVSQKRAPDELVADAIIPQLVQENPPLKLSVAPSYIQTGLYCTRCNYQCHNPCNDDWHDCARGQAWNIERGRKKLLMEVENV